MSAQKQIYDNRTPDSHNLVSRQYGDDIPLPEYKGRLERLGSRSEAVQRTYRATGFWSVLWSLSVTPRNRAPTPRRGILLPLEIADELSHAAPQQQQQQRQQQ